MVSVMLGCWENGKAVHRRIIQLRISLTPIIRSRMGRRRGRRRERRERDRGGRVRVVEGVLRGLRGRVRVMGLKRTRVLGCRMNGVKRSKLVREEESLGERGRKEKRREEKL
jgi:hypothetical protein